MRKPMVTRTFQTTEVNVLCMDLVKSEPFNQVVTLPRTYKDDKALLKKAAEIIDNDEVKAVHVVYSNVKETLYGMPEDEFIKNAEILPKKPVRADSESEE